MAYDPNIVRLNFYAINSSTYTGPWKVTPSTEWLTANLTGADAAPETVSVVFNLSVPLEGNYTVTLFTPGCVQVGACKHRGIVNVTGKYSTPVSNLSVPQWTQISQTNEFDKYDTIYFGPVNVSTDSFKLTVRLANMPGSGDSLVAQSLRLIS